MSLIKEEYEYISMQEMMIKKLEQARFKTSDKVLAPIETRTNAHNSKTIQIVAVVMGVKLSPNNDIIYDVQKLGEIDSPIYTIYEEFVHPFILTNKRKLDYE